MWLRDMPIKTKTDRDAEVPALIEFLKELKPNSLLDVGAHHTHAYYAPEVREMVGYYDGVDILKDDKTADILDNYFVGNVIELPTDRVYDVVTCVSTIEHAGLSTYEGVPVDERKALFEKLLLFAGDGAFLSFPAGRGEVVEGQMQTIPRIEYQEYCRLANEAGFGVETRFFYTQGAQAGHPWREHKDDLLAFNVPYVDFIGNQSICVMQLEKG